jgi:hypothetical protein
MSSLVARSAMAGRTLLGAATRVWGRRPLITVLTLIAVLAAAGLAQSDPGRGLLTGVGLAAPSEPYTELYFASPSAPGAVGSHALPKSPFYARARGRRGVSFVISNHEQAGVTYEWTLRSSIGTRVLHGKVWVPRGASELVTRKLVPMCGRAESSAAARQVEVRVSLAHPAESIDYWTHCNA